MTNSREQAAREWREKIWAPNVSVDDFLKSGQGELLTIDDAFIAGCEHEANKGLPSTMCGYCGKITLRHPLATQPPKGGE